MAKQDAIVVNSPRELEVPPYNKKDIIKISKDSDEADSYEEVVAIVNKGITAGDITIESGAKLYKHDILLQVSEYAQEHIKFYSESSTPYTKLTNIANQISPQRHWGESGYSAAIVYGAYNESDHATTLYYVSNDVYWVGYYDSYIVSDTVTELY